jgi:hypothetical protein
MLLAIRLSGDRHIGRFDLSQAFFKLLDSRIEGAKGYRSGICSLNTVTIF